MSQMPTTSKRWNRTFILHLSIIGQIKESSNTSWTKLWDSVRCVHSVTHPQFAKTSCYGCWRGQTAVAV